MKTASTSRRGLSAGLIHKLHHADSLQPRARMNFRLAHHYGLGAEAFHDLAHKDAVLRRAKQDRNLAIPRGFLKALANGLDEFVQL